MTRQTESAPAEYVFDPAWERETERLRTNEAIWDPGTVERLEKLGVGPGWACLEAGAGSGSMVRWLADRVGPGGRVLAADLEIERLRHLEEAPQVELAVTDLRTDELPAGAFDLVHSRMTLQHLPDRAGVVARMVAALRPGGVLFLEDTDSSTLFRTFLSEDFLRDVREAGYGLMRASGHDPRGGHVDLQLALAAGLEASAEGRTVMVRGGSVQARHYMLWLEFMRPRLVAAGLVDEARIEAALAEMADPAHYWLSQVLISTVARKPGAVAGA
ncbi:methyltransferase domain-containing protein [Streptomyces sp. N2-109]|uniref:Methyltransferase domain-containing protein n=1 Tax=Streptomyces gossypii TaxID=2883101 RepID=A0ABT2JPX8_9ACTN|nr:methyltransferase domain-containing protein [Streptomyces gossypii]MCT2589579.1 methyltransferase domain-containing protein [Streptomyces gossypii]